MKVIVSHDVDHLYLKDHFTDTFIPGSLLRGMKSVMKGSISPSQLSKRYSRELNNIRALRAFNRSYGVRETYFFGMRNGLNLSYNWKEAGPFIRYLLDEKVLVGLHGMAYDSLDLLKEEAARIKSFLPENYPLGIRNHYLRRNDETLNIMDKAGFLFDSTIYEQVEPYRSGKMWEIPISVMDAGFLSPLKNNLDELKRKSIALIEKSAGNSFFVINFHDIYFSDGYPDFKEWYSWLIQYFAERNFEFINFHQAVQSLNNPVRNEYPIHQ
jgi:hypothetical protein